MSRMIRSYGCASAMRSPSIPLATRSDCQRCSSRPRRTNSPTVGSSSMTRIFTSSPVNVVVTRHREPGRTLEAELSDLPIQGLGRNAQQSRPHAPDATVIAPARARCAAAPVASRVMRWGLDARVVATRHRRRRSAVCRVIGRSLASMRPSAASSTARSITLRNSRTLPGHR